MKRTHFILWLPIFLGVLAPTLSGCRSLDRALGPDTPEVRPDRNSPPLDAYALSGGKISRYIPTPGLPASPDDSSMLNVCRRLPLNSHTAVSAYAVIKAREGRLPIPILIVGDTTVVSLGQVIRQHMIESGFSNDGTLILYPLTSTSIRLKQGTRYAMIGNTKILLKHNALYRSSDLQDIMVLPDLLAVFHARDVKLHCADELKYVKTIYNLDPMEFNPAFERH